MKKRLVYSIIVLSFILSACIPKQPAEQTDDTTSSGLRVGDNAIYVSDQGPSSVMNIGLTSLSAPGYVVIHEDNNGKPGAIIGSSPVLGANKDIKASVDLDRKAVDGESLFAMLHFDNGDGQFDPTTDLPVKDDKSNIIMMKFNVSNDAPDPADITF